MKEAADTADLTAAQQKALKAVVAKQEAIRKLDEEIRPRLEDDRKESLLKAFEAGVPGALMARTVGISHARVYQIRADLIREGRIEEV